jgi:uncharacterized protein YggU (UPF0235/DUF167 family)
MARAKRDLPPAEAIRALADAEGRLALRVTPGARTEGIEIDGGRLLVKIRARAQEGAANEAVLALLAQALGMAKSRLSLVRGMTSREKLVQFRDE